MPKTKTWKKGELTGEIAAIRARLCIEEGEGTKQPEILEVTVVYRFPEPKYLNDQTDPPEQYEDLYGKKP